jgi:acylphosphatase
MEINMQVCYLVKVRGNVQGVYFRASSQQQAIEIGLSGYAHNLPDGSVEVLACGEQAKVEQMLKWLAKGPDSAEVVEVEQEKVEWQDLNHFSIG